MEIREILGLEDTLEKSEQSQASDDVEGLVRNIVYNIA